jgi:D-inositol-3-phosphate glycosyltransferase
VRILSVTPYWQPHRGGVEIVAQEQAHRLVRRGHHVSVLTSRLADDPPLSSEHGFPVYRVAATNALEQRTGIPYPLFSPRLLSLMTRLVQAHDVVLIHNHTYMTSVVAALAARLYNRPTVLIQYNPFVEYRFPWNVVQHGADLLLGRPTLLSVDELLAISKYTRGYVTRLVGTRLVKILQLGVDTHRFTPVSSAAEKRLIRSRLGLPKDCFLLFTVRRLVFRNGLDMLLTACARLKDQSDLFVVIGGRGPERPILEREIQREGLTNVRLPGFVPDEELPDWYRAADAFILPSRTGEGFGLVLLEAFSSGIPAISTRGGGQDEVMRERETGLFVPPSDSEALAQAILALRDQPDHTRAMGKAARAMALDMDWEQSVDQLITILEEAIDPAGSRVARAAPTG